MKNKDKPVEQLERLLDALTEDTLAMSDEEILSEATSDFGNPDKEADRVRSIIRRAVLSTGENNLKTLRKFYGESTFRALDLPNKIHMERKTNAGFNIASPRIAAKSHNPNKSGPNNKGQKPRGKK